ncbi:unnamed protein product [Rotaria magnacalcarata]|nr:unnamed protein product [Rotaria magnacalcarata]CAF1407902.1 unnamed protein product [Rotaria magnacalcarata]CAF2068056.1 unnamed protein product [Rotaria magnacalcarata]CAF2105916.1 unnamed protein product [Rotaria magnacalcarata]CAF3947861.1 unnamed protein product [Rotaria magnacalcarata]
MLDDYPCTGCYQSGLKKDSYHPGRFYCTEYNFVREWWGCCFQSRHSNGCIKLRLLENGAVLLCKCEKSGINGVCRWIQSLKDINHNYSENFHKQGVNGRLFLTLIDDIVLQDLGVSTLLHWKMDMLLCNLDLKK